VRSDNWPVGGAALPAALYTLRALSRQLLG